MEEFQMEHLDISHVNFLEEFMRNSRKNFLRIQWQYSWKKKTHGTISFQKNAHRTFLKNCQWSFRKNLQWVVWKNFQSNSWKKRKTGKNSRSRALSKFSEHNAWTNSLGYFHMHPCSSLRNHSQINFRNNNRKKLSEAVPMEFL